jgi:hypothetical protein
MDLEFLLLTLVTIQSGAPNQTPLVISIFSLDHENFNSEIQKLLRSLISDLVIEASKRPDLLLWSQSILIIRLHRLSMDAPRSRS